MGFLTQWHIRQQDLDGILHTMADKTVGFGWNYIHHADKTAGFGWDSLHLGRQDSRLWMDSAFHSRQYSMI